MRPRYRLLVRHDIDASPIRRLNWSGAPHDPSIDERLSLVPTVPVMESDFAADNQCALWHLF